MSKLNLAPCIDIFSRDVIAERWAQLKKWGEQRHPDGTGPIYRDLADKYRFLCDDHFVRGRGTWLDILLEEVYEASAEEPDSPELRGELVQVAAVALAWVENIDSRAHDRAVLAQHEKELVAEAEAAAALQESKELVFA